MRTRTFPHDGQLTELGFGASQLGNLNRAITDAEAVDAVDAAWDAGIRYFDTAPHYGLGLSERRLGMALAHRDRDAYVLSTKVGRLLEPDPAGDDRLDDEGFIVPADHRRVWDFSRDGILRSVEASLQRLGTDHIDIAYLHDPDAHWAAASTTGVAALRELRDQGVVRAIGAGMNQSAMLTDFVRDAGVDIVMVAGRYTLLDQSAALDLLPAARENGVSIVAAAVYNSGLLSTDSPSAGGRFDYRAADAATVSRAQRIAEVCRRFDVSLPAAAIAYPLRQSVVASVVVGMRNRAQATSTIDRYRADVPDELWQDLAKEGLIAS